MVEINDKLQLERGVAKYAIELVLLGAMIANYEGRIMASNSVIDSLWGRQCRYCLIMPSPKEEIIRIKIDAM